NMHSACGEQHLRTLLTHWLTYANLKFLATGCSRFSGSGAKRGHDSFRTSAGKVVGELAVHREAMSRVWTGSPESLGCILDALIGGIETRSRSSMMPLVERSSGFTSQIAMQ